MAAHPDQTFSIGIAGLGAIGGTVAAALAAGIPGLALAAISVRDQSKAEAWLAARRIVVPIVPLAALTSHCDVVVECLPPARFAEIAETAIVAGKIFVPLSVGMLLAHPDLIERARATGARILVPTGALIGLDAVRAAAEGKIHTVRMVTRKPPQGLAGAPYLVANNPANVNVAAALSLAGIGPDRTRLEIWADPGVKRNMHTIEIDAESARFSMAIENIPSTENPRTGQITGLSVIAALRRLSAPLVVGT